MDKNSYFFGQSVFGQLISLIDTCKINTIPKKLSKDETKILEKLNESENFKPHPTASEKGFFERMKEFFEH